MRYHVVAVGRIKNAALRTACDDYLSRLRHYTRVDEREVKDEARLSEAISGEARLVALSRAGESWTSAELAQRTARWDQEGREVAFAIGGADGLPVAMVERAEAVWSLSALTFPHELARVLVLEQLYRAFTIRRGEPYHRGG
jgi:23S rRNA (pseudouridine1915-N3)-methyltransferase